MFAMFRKKRIDRYAQDACRYVSSTYEPSFLPSQKEPPIKYCLPKSDDGIKYSDRELVRYSSRGSDGVPVRGDQYHLDTVNRLFSEYLPDSRTLANMLNANLNLTFVDMLTRYISTKGWRDSRVYKAARIDRRLFSKIMSDREYKPAKDTALALAIALELTLQQTNDLLDRAGYTLSHSNKRDVIIEYFIREGVYSLADINEVLYKLNQKIIGR